VKPTAAYLLIADNGDVLDWSYCIDSSTAASINRDLARDGKTERWHFAAIDNVLPEKQDNFGVRVAFNMLQASRRNEVQDLVKEGLSAKEIAEKAGVHVDQVRKWRAKMPGHKPYQRETL
jgi:DNA-binding NarL/FixJ family response regulator